MCTGIATVPFKVIVSKKLMNKFYHKRGKLSRVILVLGDANHGMFLNKITRFSIFTKNYYDTHIDMDFYLFVNAHTDTCWIACN